MRNDRSGYALLSFLLIVLFVGVVYAANNDAPSGWAMANRERAKWAMGQGKAYWADASATNTINPTGVAVGDCIVCIANMSDTSEAMPDLDNCTVAANAISSSDTPFTATERYLVIVHRPQSDPR